MKSDVTLLRTADRLVKAARENDAPVWRDLAGRLTGPTRRSAEVNVSLIDRACSEDETVAVPGKVLGAGRLSKPVTVGAFAFSEGAVRRIEDAGGRALKLEELVEESPAGSGVRLLE
ncbi:MAG: 50S ribosomal protein L18e [Methanonatronarchaeales archaeon]|nr:50S ribosomal protein L18e [Methanonatronarchaeales archaeon]